MEFNVGMFRLDREVALVVDAVYGIGFEITRSLITAGVKIIFNNLSQGSVDEGIAHYKEAGTDAKGYVCDVIDEEMVQTMVQQIKKDMGSVGVLANNAGIIKRAPMIEMGVANLRQVIDVDLSTPFTVSKVVIPDMIGKGGGKIISICSIMSELRRETISAYVVAEGRLKMLTRNIASEYGQYNVQCNGIGPGYIATPQTTPLCETQENGERHPFDRFIVGRTPAARWGEPIDLTGPSVFLASSTSNFVNGHILYVGGGIPAYIGKQP